MFKTILHSRLSYYCIVGFVFLFTLYQRDLTPINELKYYSIAIDSLANGDWFSFYFQGEAYSDKPPLYFWLIMLGLKLFNLKQSVVFVGLFSVLPAIGICEIFYQWSKTRLNQDARLAGIGITLTSGLFLGASAILRMDILMCFFIIIALYQGYLIFEKKASKQAAYLFWVAVFFALFTKGPVGLLMPILCVLVYGLVNKQLESLRLIFQIKPILVFLSLVATWFICVYLEAGGDYLYQLTIEQLVNRGVKGSAHPEPWYYYLISLFKISLPWSLLIVSTLAWGVKQKVYQDNLIKFFFTCIFSTLVLLSVSSSKLDIYLLPVLPFMSFGCILIIAKFKSKLFTSIHLAIINTLFLYLALTLILKPSLVLPSFIQKNDILGAALCLLFSVMICFYLLKQNKHYQSIQIISIGIILSLGVTAIKLPKYNQYIGIKNLAQRVSSLTESQPKSAIYIYDKKTQSIDVYLGKRLKRVESVEAVNHLPKGSLVLAKNRKNRFASKFQGLDYKIEELGGYAILIR